MARHSSRPRVQTRALHPDTTAAGTHHPTTGADSRQHRSPHSKPPRRNNPHIHSTPSPGDPLFLDIASVNSTFVMRRELPSAWGDEWSVLGTSSLHP
jgi:hypothetical protein